MVKKIKKAVKKNNKKQNVVNKKINVLKSEEKTKQANLSPNKLEDHANQILLDAKLEAKEYFERANKIRTTIKSNNEKMFDEKGNFNWPVNASYEKEAIERINNVKKSEAQIDKDIDLFNLPGKEKQFEINYRNKLGVEAPSVDELIEIIQHKQTTVTSPKFKMPITVDNDDIKSEKITNDIIKKISIFEKIGKWIYVIKSKLNIKKLSFIQKIQLGYYNEQDGENE